MRYNILKRYTIFDSKDYFSDYDNVIMKQFIFFLLIPLATFAQPQFDEVNKLFEKNQFVKAEKLAQQLVNDNPKSLKAIELLGDAYGYQKNWDKAINNYKILVDKEPEVANYHYKYGGVLGMKALSVSKLRALGLIGDLKQAFLKAAELDPNHIGTRWALVELYMQLPGIIGGSKRKSLKYAEELQILSEVDGYLAKGFIYTYHKDFELAELNYLKALEVGGSVTCYKNIIDMYIDFKKNDEAKIYLEEASKIHDANSFNAQFKKLNQRNN